MLLEGVVTSDWKRWIHIAMLLLIPLSGNAVTPMVTAGYGSALALKSDGTMTAWGRNDYGQLGNGQAAIRASPIKVTGIDRVTAVAAGNLFTLALRTDGSLWSWGTNVDGELGDGTLQNKSHPVRVTGVSGTAVSIAVGTFHSLALTADGVVWAWGYGDDGQLGNGLGPGKYLSAVRVTGVTGLPAVRAVVAGERHSLALATDGTVWAWGANNFGQLGNGTNTNRSTPLRIATLSSIVAISTHNFHNLALDTSGRVWAWGNGGALGDKIGNDRTTPFVVPGLPQIAAIAAGYLISMAVATDGSVWVWGSNEAGQFGDSRYASQASPTQVANLAGYTGFAVGTRHVIARDGSGAVRAWGQNDQGQLGVGDTSDRAAPTLVTGLQQLLQISAGQTHSVAAATDGSVWAWGTNGNGELGDSAVAVSNIPVTVQGPGNTAAVAAGTFHNLALGADGSVWSWGSGSNGALGNGTRRSSLLPLQVPGLPVVTEIAGGNEFSLARESNGTVWSWGMQDLGRLGNGQMAGTQLAPKTLTTISGVTRIAAGYAHALAIRSDGSVWSWGTNRYGQLGNGSTTDAGTPQRVTGLSNIIAVSAGGLHSLALDGSGNVWAWGYNYYGDLGDGTRSDRLAPVRVAGLSGAVAISAGENFSCAIAADGRLWTWGDNGFGQTGTGSTATRAPVATPVPGIAGFQSIKCSFRSAAAMRTDGTVWAWGSNFSGEIGDGSFASRDQPALVVNATVDGPLDLNPQVANSMPPDRIPPFLVAANKSGDLSSISLFVDVKGAPGAGTFASASNFGNFAAAYNVYVAASVPSGGTPLYYQLDSNNNWSALRWPMAEFMRGVALDSQTALVRVQILQNTDLSQLVGASILVGYGTDPDEMVRGARYRTIFTVPQP